MRSCTRRRTPSACSLLLVLALAAAGFAGYQALQDSGTSGPELREEVRGEVGEAVDELKGLIEDNTQ